MEITMAEEKRINAMQLVSQGQLLKGEAGRILDISLRQINRLLVKLKEGGIRSLIHGNRGRIWTAPRQLE